LKMNVKKQIVRGGGTILLAGFLAAGTPTFAAESNSESPARTLTRAVAGPPTGAYLKTLWSTSNQFGSGQAWFEKARDGTRVVRLTYVGLNGQTVSTTATSHRVEVVTSAGSFGIQTLPRGKIIESVFVRPGACQAEPGNIVAVTGASATIELDAHGAPVDPVKLAGFEKVQKAFQCRLGPLASQFHSFLAVAGVSFPKHRALGMNLGLPIVPTASEAGATGQVHTMVSQACAEAEAEYAAAMALLVVATMTLDPLGVAVGLAAAEAAAKAVEKACNV
jgi:hypothetical protein